MLKDIIFKEADASLRITHCQSFSLRCKNKAASSKPAQLFVWMSRSHCLSIVQVQRYLEKYIQQASLSRKRLAHVCDAYQHALRLDGKCQQNASEPFSAEHDAEKLFYSCSQEVAAAYTSYLDLCMEAARAQFTQYNHVFIVLGISVMVLSLAVQGLLAWKLTSGGNLMLWKTFESGTLLCLLGIHVLGIFSVGFLMGEGRAQNTTLMVLYALLMRSSLVVLYNRQVLATKAGKHPVQSKQRQSVKIDGKPKSWGVLLENILGVYSITSSRHDGTESNEPLSWTVKSVVCCYCILFCCIIALQNGLIDRSGQDPHDKTFKFIENLGGDKAMISWTRGVFILLPMVLVPLVFHSIWCLILTVCQDRSRPRAETPRKAKHMYGFGWMQWACSAQTALCSMWWCVRMAGASDYTIPELSKLIRSKLLSGSSRSMMRSERMMPQILAIGFGQRDLFSVFAYGLSVPLRLLLPRLVYIISVFIVLWRIVAACLRSYKCRKAWDSCIMTMHSTHGEHFRSEMVIRELIGLIAVLATPLAILLGSRGPSIVVLGVIQTSVSIGLTGQVLKARHQSNGPTSIKLLGENKAEQEDYDLLMRPLREYVFLSVGLVSMQGNQLFFNSGHFCEFSGLQYTAAFVGFDEVQWLSSGALLVWNTFGMYCLSALCVPVICALGTAMFYWPNKLSNAAGYVAPRATRRNEGVKKASNRACVVLSESLAQGVCVFTCISSAKACAAMLSAAIQHGHILLWAIFAPRLVFELFVVLLSGIFLSLSVCLITLFGGLKVLDNFLTE